MVPALLAQAPQGVAIDTIPVEGQVLFIGLLFLGTLAISRFSIQVGVPAILGVLLLGLAININYLDITHQQAENLHVFALALLLFYAGLKTDIQAIRGFLPYGLALAVGGVALATLLLGGLIWLLSSAGGDAISPGTLDAMPLGAALLIAACLGSTDAGATISVLASVRQLVPERLQHLLEFESSVNDPTALLLFGLVAGLFTTGQADGAPIGAAGVLVEALRSFVQQVASGLVIGALFGYVARFVIDQLAQDRSQLLIMAMSIAFIDYGSCQLLGGAGLIAVYTTGLLMTNMRYRQAEFNHESIQEALLPFNTMAEICLFLIFGLLVTPASLVPALPVGLASAAVLMLVVRPFSVLAFQSLSPFNRKESLFVSWCGLRGAVPLALSYNAVNQIGHLRGVSPAAVGALAQNAQSIVFIVVLVNLLAQGLTLPRLCVRLGLVAPAGN
ncbi:cation:proton antiporter [Cyanobium sp. FACHB-13342]|uniref:cation:proton antiporter domain-containing protein n=1 Tax=Cyanobium sp. FACHB-13342 TaxID=2692793 RepID=UPI0016807EB7|nr:cation:proton antiporter [Cyanobium sp. FACHB-13342]MBD2422140.1 cation:proton antiporter [Cyanobium sp. FACHB-13342]